MMDMVVLDLKTVRSRHGYTFLLPVIASQFDLVAINDYIGTVPDPYAGRNGVVNGVILYNDIVRVIEIDAGIIGVRSGVMDL